MTTHHKATSLCTVGAFALLVGMGGAAALHGGSVHTDGLHAPVAPPAITNDAPRAMMPEGAMAHSAQDSELPA